MKKHQPDHPLPVHLPPYPHFLKIFSALLEAFDEAIETGERIWEYAVELHDLHDQGAPSSTLRWLMDKRVISHGYEQKGRSARRRFRQTRSHFFQDNSCFVLVAESVGQVRQMLLEAPSALPQNNGASGGKDNRPFGLPYWNKPAGELWYEDNLVKIIPETAHNQRKLLDYCQASQWRQPFENCFKIHPDKDDGEPDTLHNTLVRLNAHQINPRLHFYRDGSGKRFRFKVIPAKPARI